MCSDFLPPWLRGADDDEPKKSSPPPPPEPTADDAEVILPPWMKAGGERPREFVSDTGELSEDFLAAADELPDSLPASVTYDQWRAIQHEKTRERSLDEEVPDLLEDLPDLSGGQAGTGQLPNTGELPDWFLGLEELDEEQAPDWYVDKGTPPAPTPPPPPVEPPSDALLDDFFGSISAQRGQGGAQVPDDVLSALMQPDLNDTQPITSDPASPVYGDPGLADFAEFAGGEVESRIDDFGTFPRVNTDELNAAFADIGDWASTPPRRSDDDPASYGQSDEAESQQGSYRAGRGTPIELPEAIEYNFDDFAPTSAAHPEQAEPTIPSRSLLSKLTSRAAAPQPPPAVEPQSVEADSSLQDDMSWLNEISAMVDSVVERGSSDEGRSSADAPPYTRTGRLDSGALNSELLENQQPDWLTDIQAVSPPESGLLSSDPPQSAQIDFSGMDFAAFGRGDARTDAGEGGDDPFLGLFADIGGKQKPEQPLEMPRSANSTVILTDSLPGEPSSSGKTVIFDDFTSAPSSSAGQTIVLDDDTPTASSMPPGTTIELDDYAPAALPSDPAQKPKPASPLSAASTPSVPSTEDILGGEIAIPPVAQEQRQTGFVGIVIPPPDNPSVAELIPLLTDTPLPQTNTLLPFDTPAPAEEDMSWLQTVRFDGEPEAPMPSPVEVVNAPVVEHALPEEAEFDAAAQADLSEHYADRVVPHGTGGLDADAALAALFGDLTSEQEAVQDGDDAGASPSLLSQPREYAAWVEPTLLADAQGTDVEPVESSALYADADVDDAFGALFGSSSEQPDSDYEEALPASFDVQASAADSNADDAFSKMFGDLGATSLDIQEFAEDAPSFAANTGELNDLFGAANAGYETQDEDSDAAVLPSFRVNTDELSDLFGDLEASDEDSEETPRAEMTGLLSRIHQPLKDAEETFMPPKDDFDSLFDDMDDPKPSRQESESLPTSGMLSGDSQAEDDEVFAPDDTDLDALFAAYEDEQRNTGESSGEASDDFFASFGLDDFSNEPPPDPGKPPGRGDEGFSPPEMTNTTDISGEDTTSLWEDENEDFAEDDLPKVPAFDFDAVLADDSVGEPSPSAMDWVIDESAQPAAPFASDWDAPLPPPPTPVESPSGKVPDWLSELDPTDDTIPVPPGATVKAPPADLESFLAHLDAPETLLPQSTPLAEPPENTAEFDIDKLFTDEFPALETENLPAPDAESLSPADMLGDLGAEVGNVSAGAIARQMTDRPEGELSDRLQRLRQRATDEFAPVGDAAPQDDIAKVLPGVANVIAPAPFVVEPQNLSEGIVLTSLQQQHAALLRDLVGLPSETKGRGRKPSAIDLTYEAPHLREQGEAAPERITGEQVIPKSSYRQRRTYRIDRLLISILLAAGIALPFFVPALRIGDLPPPAFAANSREDSAFAQIERLDPFTLVLVSLDYSPGAAAELDAMTEAMTRHILLRGARPIFVSSNPFALLRVEAMLLRLNADRAFLSRLSLTTADPLRENGDFYVARFLPGSAVGLRAFGENIGALLTTDINGQTSGLNIESLRNLALLVLISDRADDVRAYAEQIAPLTNRPFVVAVNYASAPLAEPYAAGSVVDGFLVGYDDAVTYSNMVNAVEGVERDARPLDIDSILTTPESPAPSAPGDADATPEGTPAADATPAPGETPATDATAEATAEAAPVLTGLTATVISADGANVRSGPGTDFARIAGAARNSTIAVLGFSEDGDWVNVRLEDGTEGWVSAGLIVVNEATEAEPTGTPAASGIGAPSLLRQTSDDPAPLDAESPEALRWYAMNIGIILSALIITLGGIFGVVRGIFRRKARP